MHRGGWWIVALALVPLPLSAQSLPAPACAIGAPQPLPLTYLENCWECTETTSCDTECGFDPDKGRPVTCGEYGVCASDPCYWVLAENLGPCDWDSDLHFDAVVVEIYSAQRYVHTCTNAECFRVYRSSSVSCNNFSSGCGFSGSNCCDCRFGANYCDHLEGCPAETCPF